MMIFPKKRGILVGVCSVGIVTLIYLSTLYTISPPPIHTRCATPTIYNVEQLISTLNSSTLPECFTPVRALLDRLYIIEISEDQIKVPPAMQDMVKNTWFKGNTDLYAKFQHPITMVATNILQSETTSVNPLRSQRPKPAGSDRIYEAVMEQIEGSRKGCNFCSDNLTLEDSFGRVYWKKKHIFTAENAFRFYDHVGLMVPADTHNYMEIDYQTFESMFTYVAIRWWGNIQDENPERTHPVFLWDILGKSGASQVHPHVQMLLGRGFYPGKIGQIDNAAKRYAQLYPSSNYLQDMVEVHIALGLGLRHKSAAMIVPLHSAKDHGIMIIGTVNLYDWTWLYYVAHRTYIEKLQVYCFSSAGGLPSSMINKGKGGGDLMVVNLGSRGDCTSKYNDVSSLELFAVNSISSDFYVTMKAFKETYEKYKEIHPVVYENA